LRVGWPVDRLDWNWFALKLKLNTDETVFCLDAASMGFYSGSTLDELEAVAALHISGAEEALDINRTVSIDDERITVSNVLAIDFDGHTAAQRVEVLDKEGVFRSERDVDSVFELAQYLAVYFEGDG
jgi:hypothetical protein